MKRQDASRLVHALYQGWYPSLVRYACRSCGRLDVAEEAVQEAFMALFRELVDGSSIDNPKAWTLVVVRREIGKRHRAQKHQRAGLERWAAEEPRYEIPMALDPGAGRMDDLTRLFSVLSQREEEIVLLRLQAFDYSEIAKQLDISRNTVKTLLARAFRKLREAAGRGAGSVSGETRSFDDNHDVSETLH